MNNEITLRTNKGQYHPGESVFGAVYLRICRPTEGCGIKIAFRGIETCEYNYECNGKKSINKETVHVDFSDITLYSQDGCFQFGTYVFPFVFQLPNEIAGTTEVTGENEQSSWKVNVSYWLKTWVKGSNTFTEIQPVVVYQCPIEKLEESNAGTAKFATFEIKRFGFSNKVIHITVKLVENYKASGSNSQLRLIVTNDSKVIVSGIDIKLKRYLKLTFLSNDCDTDNLTTVMTPVCGSGIEILPESGPYLVHSMIGWSDSVMAKFVSGGLDNLQIPLVEKTTKGERIDLPPSSEGKCFKNRYCLDVTISFSNGQAQTLSLLIPGVLPQTNKKWASWKAKDWHFTCETKLSSSLFSVAEDLLYTEAFSSLPGFQVL